MRIIIDSEFKGMIPPLKPDEYKCLEESLLSEGCRDPIMLWNSIIVDGHNRYEICTRLNIPYKVNQKQFSNRDEAISWICLNQLSRRNISGEAFRYLVGKRYDAEKRIAQQKNPSGANQYSPKSEPYTASESLVPDKSPVARRTSTQIGNLYNLNHATVERYGRLSRSLDEIERKSPGMLPVILSGACKVSKDNIDVIAQMPDKDIQTLSAQFRSEVAGKKHISVRETSKVIKGLCDTGETGSAPALITGIKCMPAYDPDAIINEIVLTVPTWKTELDKLIDADEWNGSSDEACKKLFKVLSELQSSISRLQSRIRR